MTQASAGLPLSDVVATVMGILRKMATGKNYGEIKITVQNGQTVTITEQVSYRDQLPFKSAEAQKSNLPRAANI